MLGRPLTLPRNLAPRRAYGALVLLISGCQPVQLYPGPARPEGEVAHVYFSKLGAEITAVSVDGRASPSPGRTMQVLPGSHWLSLQYKQRFGDSGLATHDDDDFRTERPGFGVSKVGTCSIHFFIAAKQELSITVEAGRDSLFDSSTPPSISMKEFGFNQPIRYEGQCKDQRPVVDVTLF